MSLSYVELSDEELHLAEKDVTGLIGMCSPEQTDDREHYKRELRGIQFEMHQRVLEQQPSVKPSDSVSVT